MKIVSSGKVLNSQKFYKKKKRKRRIQIIILFVALVSVASLVVYLSRQKRFLITEVTVQGDNVVGREEIAQTAQRLLGGYYLWVIPRADTFIYPRRAIRRKLIEAFPRLKSVDLNLNEFQTLVVTVEERAPFALYCASEADQCFFLDEEGFIFASAPSFSNGVYFTYLTEAPMENPIGKRFATPAEFGSLLKFMKDLLALNIHPSALEVGANDYSLLLSNNRRIIWRRGDDLLLVRSNLEAFLSDDSIRAQSQFLDKILYLDLRTPNKVFYKFK